MACPICGGEQIFESRPFEVTFKGNSRTVDMPGHYCTNCGEGVLSGKDMKKSNAALADIKAEIAGVYTPAEVREIRNSLNMTQGQASNILGGGPRGFQRYESGSVTVSKPMHNLLKLIKRHPDLVDELKD